MAIDDVITKAADQISSAVEKYGPQAVDFSRELGRLAAGQQILFGIGSLLVAALIYWLIALPLHRKIKADWPEGETDVFDAIEPPVGIGWFFAHLAVVIFCIGGIYDLLNIFAWVGLWRPEIYLAAKFLRL